MRINGIFPVTAKNSGLQIRRSFFYGSFQSMISSNSKERAGLCNLSNAVRHNRLHINGRHGHALRGSPHFSTR